MYVERGRQFIYTNRNERGTMVALVWRWVIWEPAFTRQTIKGCTSYIYINDMTIRRTMAWGQWTSKVISIYNTVMKLQISKLENNARLGDRGHDQVRQPHRDHLVESGAAETRRPRIHQGSILQNSISAETFSDKFNSLKVLTYFHQKSTDVNLFEY
jgi:hypothetical protein